MASSMKTTIDIAEELLISAKEAAHREGTTLRQLVEEGLRTVLAGRRARVPFRLRDGSYGGRGLQPGIDIGDWSRIREMIYEGHGG